MYILTKLSLSFHSASIVRNDHFEVAQGTGASFKFKRSIAWFIIWPVRPRARFHCKTIDKIPVWEPYAMARAGPEKAVRTCQDHVRPSYGDFINSARKMRTETTLSLYKSQLFGQNERRKWTFRLPEKKKEKGKARWPHNNMLIDWVRSGRTGKYLALGHCARTSLRSVRTPNIFPSSPPTQSISTYSVQQKRIKLDQMIHLNVIVVSN